MPISLQHNIEQLHESVLVGAATSVGDLIAVLESSGRVKLFRLDREISGGLCCHALQDSVLEIKHRLFPQDSAPPTSLRFQETLGGLRIFAIDRRGKLIVKTLTEWAYPPLTTPEGPKLPELPSKPGTQLDSKVIYQLEDSAAPAHNATPPDPQTMRTPVCDPLQTRQTQTDSAVRPLSRPSQNSPPTSSNPASPEFNPNRHPNLDNFDKEARYFGHTLDLS